MSGDQLNADAEQYLQAAGLNVTPPPITSDPLVTGGVPIEQLLRILGMAANAGDPQDNAEGLQQHAERDAIVSEAATQFPAQDENAGSELSALSSEGPEAAQLAQQVPQMASGIAGALAGALGGALQPLAQMPQQLAQGAQQAMQTGMGVIQQAAGTADQLDTTDISDAPADDFEPDLEAFDDSAGGGEDGGIGGTAPTAMLGPPPIPSASTFPSAAPFTPTAGSGPGQPPSTPSAGVSGMPMVPPGAMRSGNSSNDVKPDLKRVSVPPVKNGAPVQGRIAVPQPPPVTKHVDGKAVAAKRIIVSKNSPPPE